MMFSELELKEIHTRSSNHREEVMDSDACGCFYCRRIFHPSEIREWIDYEDTALCPKCGIDSVLAIDVMADNTEMIHNMSEYWFNLYRDEWGNFKHARKELLWDGHKKT